MKRLLYIILLCSSFSYSQNIWDGLAAYYPLNCNILDTTSNNLNGTLNGNISCTIGKLYDAIHFQKGSYIDFPANRSKEFISANGFAWSIWFKLDSLPIGSQPGRFQTFISIASETNNEDIYLGIGSLSDDRDKVCFIVDGPGGFGASATGNSANLSFKPTGGLKKDTWYHVLGQRDYLKNTVELYFNGYKVDSASYSDPQLPLTQDLPTSIGRFSDGLGDIGSYFTGSLDEIRIYNRILTEKEILILFSARAEQISTDNVNINFSNIQCRADSTIIKTIKNEGPSEFIISNFRLTQNKEFSIVNNNRLQLIDQEIYALGVKFTPSSESIFYDTLFVDNEFGVQPLIFYLQGSKEVRIDIADTIDIGFIVDCEQNQYIESKIPIFNDNIDDGLIVKSIELEDGTLLSSSGTFAPIKMGEIGEFSITYTPASSGTFYENVNIYFENCDLFKSTIIKAEKQELKLEFQNNIDFGFVEVNSAKLITTKIRNIGTADFQISNIIPSNPNSEFSFISSTFTNPILKPNEQSFLDLGFYPKGGKFEDTLIVEINSKCGVTNYVIFASGNGKYRAEFELSIKEINTKIGEEVKFELELKNPKDLDIALIDSIAIDLELNTSVVFPLSELTLFDSSEVFKQKYRFYIDPNDVNENQTFELFGGKIALGTESNPNLIFEPIVIDGFANITSVINKINIEDICELGGAKRLFSSNNYLDLGQISPNPSIDNIHFKFSIIESGRTKISIYDNFGNIVIDLINNDLEIGDYQANFDISNLETGSYFYTMTTPTQKISKRFIKLK